MSLVILSYFSVQKRLLVGSGVQLTVNTLISFPFEEAAEPTSPSHTAVPNGYTALKVLSD